MIRLSRHEKPPVDVKDPRLMFRIIRASFNQRRKTLVNGLKNAQDLDFTKEEIDEEQYLSADFPPGSGERR